MPRRFEFVSAYKNAELPKPARKTKFSAGYDLCAAENILIPPGETVLIPTGVRAFMNEDECLLIQLRSSVGLRRGLIQPNAPAVIDADYVNVRSDDQFKWQFGTVRTNTFASKRASVLHREFLSNT